MKKASVYLDAEDRARLERLAVELGISQAEVMLRASSSFRRHSYLKLITC